MKQGSSVITSQQLPIEGSKELLSDSEEICSNGAAYV